jgi:hypothetical protein
MASSDYDAALAGSANQGRKPMGKDGIAFTATSATGTGKATLVPKKGAQAGDPTGAGSKANRSNVSQTPGGERTGAAYSIKARYTKATDPAAGMTQANGKIVATATKRDRTNFDGGMGASY